MGHIARLERCVFEIRSVFPLTGRANVVNLQTADSRHSARNRNSQELHPLFIDAVAMVRSRMTRLSILTYFQMEEEKNGDDITLKTFQTWVQRKRGNTYGFGTRAEEPTDTQDGKCVPLLPLSIWDKTIDNRCFLWASFLRCSDLAECVHRK